MKSRERRECLVCAAHVGSKKPGRAEKAPEWWWL